MTATLAESLRVPGDNDERYYTYPPTGELFTSVTTITGGTDSKPWLSGWSAKLAAEFAVNSISEITALVAAGERDKAIALIKGQAKQARDLKADVGKYVHAVAEALVLWAASPEGRGGDIALPTLPDHLAGTLYDEQPVEDVADWMITGFLNWVTDWDPMFEASEMVVFHAALKVAGTLDAIIRLAGRDLGPDGELVAAPGRDWVPCVDIKTGKHFSPGWPEQTTAYRRSPEALLPMGELVPMPPTDGSAILHIRPEYPRGYRFMPVSRRDDALAWNRFRRAAELFTGRKAAQAKPGRPAYPLRPDGTLPPRLLSDLDGEGYGRAPAALVKAGVADLAALAALDEAGCLALKGIGAKTLPVIRQILTGHGLALSGDVLPEPLTGKAA